jgi:hypothetical protein
MIRILGAALAVLCIVLSTGLASAGSAPDPELVRGQRMLDQLEAAIDGLKPGDVAAYNGLTDQLAQARRSLSSTRSKQLPEYAAAVERWNRDRARLVDIAADWKKAGAGSNAAGGATPEAGAAKAAPAAASSTPPAAGNGIEALNEDVIAAFEETKKITVDAFADEAFYRQWNQRLAAFATRLEAFAGDPNHGVVAGNLAKLRGNIEAAHVAPRIKAIEAKYAASQFHDLAPEANPQEAAAWAGTMRRLLEVELPEDLAAIDGFASSGAIDRDRKSSLDHWIGTVAKGEVQQKIDAAARMLDGRVDRGIETAQFVEQTDATDRDQVANRLIGAESYERYTGLLRDGLAAVEVATAFDQALGRSGGPDRAAEKARITAAVERYQQLVAGARDSVRMPPARSTDPTLLQVAADTLKNPDYESAGGWRRLVINYDLQHKEKWEGEYRTGTVQDTVTVYHYVWDEFQVTTAEKVGDRYFMFANRLKFFQQGGPTTPTGRWILADRFQTTEILEANIDK